MSLDEMNSKQISIYIDVEIQQIRFCVKLHFKYISDKFLISL